VLALYPDRAAILPIAEARAAGLLVVDLGDDWAPFIFGESDPGAAGGSDAGAGEVAAPGPRPNAYRRTFIDLANDRVDPEELFLTGGATRALDLSPEAEERRKREARDRRLGKRPPPPPPPPAPRKRSEPVRNYLEVFGIPPTLSVLQRRIEQDAAASCWGALDRQGLQRFAGGVTFQNPRQARRDHEEVDADRGWLAGRLAQMGDAGVPGDGGAPLVFGTAPVDAGALPWDELGLASPPAWMLEQLRTDPREVARLDRLARGLARRRAIQALQARLACEGLLTGKSRHVQGMFDLPTHQALAAWERKNDIFGWGFLAEETLTALQRPPLELHRQTFERVLTERLADAAGIIEDGTVSSGKRPATYRDADGERRPVPNLIAEHLRALLAALQIENGEQVALFLRTMGQEGLRGLHLAFTPPLLPPYYAPHMELEVEIDRGDIWYDFPFGPGGQTAEQKRERYPSLTLLTTWNGQRIPLARWRTTIGSWRSELHPDGSVYYKYKNSDVGPRIWKQVVAAPVWVPPDSTPSGDLLTRKIFDIRKGPVPVVNTEVMGPGFQSAYGLVMAIHHKVLPGGGLFDNQIRTHGSVDYTSIARRFSHGCHRLVNTRAVRLFGYVLRHRTHLRQGDNPLHIKKIFTHEGQRYGYELDTRGYYYELVPPLPVNVLEGRIVGTQKKPITTYIRKPGVVYQASSSAVPGEAPLETAPTLGP
jgi:hypothetical protein